MLEGEKRIVNISFLDKELLGITADDSHEPFETMPLFTSRLYLVVHQSRPLAALPSITLGRLSRVPLILPEIVGGNSPQEA